MTDGNGRLAQMYRVHKSIAVVIPARVAVAAGIVIPQLAFISCPTPGRIEIELRAQDGGQFVPVKVVRRG